MSASTLVLTEKNFEETLNKGGILFIDFWAGWCGPCLRFAPAYEAAAARHPDITFSKVDTEDQEGLAQAFDIRAIPTLAIFRDGVLLAKNSGALPEKALEDLIEQVRKVDMKEVLAEVAKQRAAQAPKA